MSVFSLWTPLRVVHDSGSWTIYAVPLPSGNGDFHFIVQWDEDRDPRVLGAVLALYYRHPALFLHVLVWSEHKAHLVVGAVNDAQGVPRVSELHRALVPIVSEQSYAIEWDAWDIEVVPIRNLGDTRDWGDLSGIHRTYKLGPVLP